MLYNFKIFIWQYLISLILCIINMFSKILNKFKKAPKILLSHRLTKIIPSDTLNSSIITFELPILNFQIIFS